MDAIARAIKKNWHISNNVELNQKTWDDFDKELVDKTLVLFGIGDGADFYYYKYGETASADIIIDNNSELHGIEAQKIISEAIDEKHKNIKIGDISCLEKLESEDIVFLVCSLKYYTEIAQQLLDLGYKHIFALLPMEANERKWNGVENYCAREEVYKKEACKEKISENKIVVYSMFDFAGHGKAIVNQLLLRDENFDIVWLVDSLNVSVPKGVRIVWKRNRRQCYMEMETAKVWICDTGIPDKYIKRSGQVYIQVKHWASITLKNFGFDLARARQDETMLKFCEYDSSLIDYIVVGSEFDEKTCRSGFEFSGEFLHAGSPRTDILFNASDIREEVRDKYGLSNQAKILLYAPTFRCKNTREYSPDLVRADLDFITTKAALEEKFGGTWYIFLRLHPVVAKQSKNIEKPPCVIDVSEYFDSEELIAATDVMITDYSSIMFEPAFVKKPVFLFTTDRDAYVDEERKLLIDYDTLPFPIAESNEELARVIEQFDEQKYVEEVTSFLDSYGVHEDGHASERVAEFISDLIGK